MSYLRACSLCTLQLLFSKPLISSWGMLPSQGCKYSSDEESSTSHSTQLPPDVQFLPTRHCRIIHYPGDEQLPHVCNICLSIETATALKSTAKLRGVDAKNSMFQCFSPSATGVQNPTNAVSSNDLNLSVIPEATQVHDSVSQVQSFSLSADDANETSSVSSWSVVSDHA